MYLVTCCPEKNNFRMWDNALKGGLLHRVLPERTVSKSLGATWACSWSTEFALDSKAADLGEPSIAFMALPIMGQNMTGDWKVPLWALLQSWWQQESLGHCYGRNSAMKGIKQIHHTWNGGCLRSSLPGVCPKRGSVEKFPLPDIRSIFPALNGCETAYINFQRVCLMPWAWCILILQRPWS